MTPLQKKSKILRNAALPYIFLQFSAKVGILSEDSPENWAKAVQTSSAMEAVKVGGTVGGRIFAAPKGPIGTVVFVDFTKRHVFFFALTGSFREDPCLLECREGW